MSLGNYIVDEFAKTVVKTIREKTVRRKDVRGLRVFAVLSAMALGCTKAKLKLRAHLAL